MNSNSKRKKNKNGQGGVYPHKATGTYYGRCTDPNTGKLKTTAYYKTQKEAQNALNTLIYELRNNMYIDKSNVTLYQLAKEYVEDQYKNNEIIGNTYRTKQDSLKRISKLTIANMPIQNITVMRLKNVLHGMTEYSQTIIDKDYQLINTAYKVAVTNGILTRNPFDSNLTLRKPKSQKQKEKVQSFNVEEQQALMEALPNSNMSIKYKIMILLSVHTGMRSGEIRGLKTSDIDFKNKTITISRTASRDENGTTIIGETTKTEKGTRTLPMNDNVEYLLRLALNNYVFNSNQLLFCNSKGEPITANTLNEKIKTICIKANIRSGKRVTFHMLRHTYATRIVESGASMATIQRLLGHESIETTINIYTDITNENKKMNVEKYTNYVEQNGLNSCIL